MPCVLIKESFQTNPDLNYTLDQEWLKLWRIAENCGTMLYHDAMQALHPRPVANLKTFFSVAKFPTPETVRHEHVAVKVLLSKMGQL